MSAYQKQIEAVAVRSGYLTANVRHVEAWMLAEHGTLDRLSANRFASEVVLCIAVANEAGIETSERLAQSYGI